MGWRKGVDLCYSWLIGRSRLPECKIWWVRASSLGDSRKNRISESSSVLAEFLLSWRSQTCSVKGFIWLDETHPHHTEHNLLDSKSTDLNDNRFQKASIPSQKDLVNHASEQIARYYGSAKLIQRNSTITSPLMAVSSLSFIGNSRSQVIITVISSFILSS